MTYRTTEGQAHYEKRQLARADRVIPTTVLTDDIVEQMVIAQWNAIPAHIDYHQYMQEHPRRVEIKAALIRHMHAAIDVLIKPDDKANHA